MGIAIRGTTPATATSITPTVAVALTGARQPQAGDVLVIIHSNDWFTLADMPTPTVGGSTTGVTAITGGSADGGSFEPHAKSYTYVVNATGDLTVSVTETSTGDEEKSIVAFVLPGADTTTPIDVALTSVNVSGATSQTTPSVSPTSADAFLICHVSTGNGGTGSAYTPPAGMTEVYDFDVSASYSASGAVQQLSASGATGTKTFAATTAAHWAGLTIAVKTAAGGAPAETNYARPNTGPTPGRRGPTGRLTRQAPGSSQSAPAALVGVAAETDTVQPLSRTHTYALGIAASTDAAQPIGRVHTRAVGTAIATDAAQPVGRAHTRTMGIASTTDAAQPIGRAKNRTAGTATEASTALPVARVKTRTVGTATETDAVQPVGKAKSRTLGAATETDTALPVTAPVTSRHNLCPNPACGSTVTGWGGGSTPTQATGLTGLPVTTGARYTVNGYAQTPIAVATPGQQYTASLYVSNNTSVAIGTRTIYLAFVRSSGGDDFSQTSTADLVTGVTRASVTGTAPALTTGVYVVVDSFNAALGSGVDITACLIEQTGTLGTYFDGNSPGAHWDGAAENSTSSIGPAGATAGTASETDVALPLGRAKAKPVGVATEADAAQPLGRAKAKPLGAAAETSTALTVGRAKTRTVGTSAETDTAQGIGRAKTRAIGAAAETDTAQPVGVAASVVQRYAGPYTGPTPGWISPTGSLAPQSAGPGTLANITSRPVGAAAETDTAQPLGRAKTRAVSLTVETDAAQAVGRARIRTVGIASTTDVAVTVGRAKRRVVGQAGETDIAPPVSTPGHLIATVGTAAEFDTAFPAGRVKRRTAGVATTVDAALSLNGGKRRPVGTATSTDTALPMSGSGPALPRRPGTFIAGGIRSRLTAGTLRGPT